MNRTKLVFTTLLSASLVFSAAGCQSNGKAPEKEAGKTSSTNQEQSVKGLPAKLDNKKVSVLVYGDDIQKGFETAAKLFEEKYGGKVEYVRVAQNNEIEQKLVTAISAGDPMDLTQWSQDYMPKYAIKNLLQPVDDYIDIKDTLWAESASVMEQFKFKGKYYGFPNNQSATGIFFNKTMFENNGLKTPLEYYKEGKWNWETLQKLAKELTQDTNRDGTIDQWGFGTNVGTPDMFLLANGADFATIKADGSIEPTIKSQNFISALQFFQDGYAKDKYIANHKQAMPDFTAGKVAMLSVGDSVFTRNVAGSIKDAWDYVPFPAGAGGAKDMYPGACSFWGIVNGAKNPEGAAALYYLKRIDEHSARDPKNVETFTDAQKKLLKRIEELRTEQPLKDKTYTQEQLDLMRETRKKIKVSTTMGIGNFRQVSSELFGEIKNGTPVVNVVEKYMPLFQTEIDTMMKGSK